MSPIATPAQRLLTVIAWSTLDVAVKVWALTLTDAELAILARRVEKMGGLGRLAESWQDERDLVQEARDF